MNAVKEGREETDDAPRRVAPTSAKDEGRKEQVKSVLERRGSISCKAIATEVGISWASVQRFLTNSLGKETFVKSGFEDQRAIHFLLATTHPQRWRNEGNAFPDGILTVDESRMHLFDHQLKWQNTERRTQKSPKKKIARRCQGAPKAMHVIFFDRNGLELYHSLPFGTKVNVQYYCTLLQDKVKPAARSKESNLLQQGVILLQDNAAAHRRPDVQNLV